MTTEIEWREWLASRQAAQERLGTVQVDDRKAELERARLPIHRQCGKAWRSHDFPAGLDGAATRGDADAANVRDAMRLEPSADYAAAGRFILDLCQRASSALDWRQQSAERRALVPSVAASMEEALSGLRDAEEALKAEEKEEQAAKSALEEVERKRPKPTDEALAAIDEELASHHEYIGSLNNTLDSMKDEASAIAQAEDKANAAQAELERLEAEALMGGGKSSDQAAATTRLAKARKEAEAAHTFAQKQESARRGLTAMLQDRQAQLDDLETTRRGLAGELWRNKLATAEAAMLKVLNEDTLAPLVAEINACRAEITALDGNMSRSPARLEIKMPSLMSEQCRAAPDVIRL